MSAFAARPGRPAPAEEVALVALTLAAIGGLGRLFDGASFLMPLATVAIAGHGLAAAFRRTRLGAGPALFIGLAAGCLIVTWVVLPHALTYGIPTGATLEAAGHDLRAAWDLFATEVAPVTVERGFILASAGAIWVIALVSDWTAFRLGVVFESVVPSFTLFIFAATLGAPRQRVPATAAFLIALLAYLATRRITERSQGATWLERHAGEGLHAAARQASRLGTAVVAVAIVAAPLIPGIDAPAEIPWRSGDGGEGPGNRVTLSPLVDIRSRLVSQSALEVFSVKADRKAYWRLTSLDTFDGRIWSSVGSYRDVTRDLDGERPSGVPVAPITQEFSINALASIWLPAAYQPVELAVNPGGVSYDRASGSLLTEEETSDTMRYTVVSEVTALTPAALSAIGPSEGPDDRYLALPDDFPSRVGDLARQVTGSATGPYAQAVQLQRFFRDQFTYDLDAPPGHSDNAIVGFLFETRRGYCEQFAGSFAAMARSLGLPARVAVGFTPGVLGDDGAYHVRGEHAHAWPEVWLDDVGWVAFEPTPGRGAPGAQSYTGVPEQQAATGRPTTPTTAVPTPTTEADGTGGPSTTARTRGDIPQNPTRTSSPVGVGSWLRRAAVAVLAAVVLAALSIAALAARQRARRSHRHRAATTPAARVTVAWLEATEALGRAGLPLQRGETFAEYASRVGERSGIDGGSLRDLARHAERAVYAAAEPDTADVAHAEASAVTIVDAVRAGAPLTRRLVWAVDPRALELA